MTTTIPTRPTGVLDERLIGSPVGDLRLVASPAGVRAVLWGAHDARLPVEGVVPGSASAVLDECERQLAEYFAGDRRTFELPLAPVGTPFQQAAWEVLRGIPYGATISYAQQAQRLGDARKARAVGAANGRNPISIIVPCHRVVGANGHLTGFAGGTDVKDWLLTHERRHSHAG